jgi:hypothetical protein
MCGPCAVKGTAWQLAAFLAGVEPSDKAAVLGWLDKHGLTTVNGKSPTETSGTGRRVLATYPYHDESGTLLYEVVRYEPKDFRQRKADGTWHLDGVRRVLYRLAELMKAETVYIVEGEKDVDTLRGIGLTATCNPGGAGKWRADYVEAFNAHQHVVILPDNDEPGRKHAQQVAESLYGKVVSLKVLDLPGLPAKGDVSDWLATGGTWQQLEALVSSTPGWTRQATQVSQGGPWATAVTAQDFLLSADEEVDWLEYPFLAPGSITEFFSPRGLGKTHVALYLAVKLAKIGKRVLLLDRDNARREVKRRLKAWGAADARTLKVLTRDEVPPLTDAAKWATFPFSDYDMLMIDSLDASSEGAGEKDSAKPSRAIAPLLDIAHRASGPAVLILGNTIKSGTNSRGSGVIEDRADIVYEVRDATDFKPTGEKQWWEELPAQGAGDWATRASRRKRRERLRLAFVASKFRVGEEPQPMMLEIDLSGDWTVRDVTEEVCGEAECVRSEAVESAQKEDAHRVQMLISKVRSSSELIKGEAEEYLQSLGASRDNARAIIDRQTAWTLVQMTERPGKPWVLTPVSSGAAAETYVPGNLEQTGVSEDGIFAAIDNSHPRQCAVPESAPIKGFSEQAFPRLAFLEQGNTDEKRI